VHTLAGQPLSNNAQAQTVAPARPTPAAIRTVAGLAIIGSVAVMTVLIVSMILIRRNRARLLASNTKRKRPRRIPDAWRESARRLPDRDTAGHETVDLDPDELDPRDEDEPDDDDTDDDPRRDRPKEDRP
jgi:hypothetical protein